VLRQPHLKLLVIYALLFNKQDWGLNKLYFKQKRERKTCNLDNILLTLIIYKIQHVLHIIRL